MKNINVTISIDKEIFKKFKIRLIELEIKNQSLMIEKLIEKWLTNIK